MFNIVKKEIDWQGNRLSIETGKIGRQASSVIARMNNTIVMANVTVGHDEMTGLDFTPLTISYIEKYYAAGQIPPGFVKRETKPSEHELLIARLIDRPIRPLFPSNYRYETNVFCTLLSYDLTVPVEIVSSIAASAALAISPACFGGPTACARVGYVNGEYTLNTINPFDNGGKLDLFVSGTKDSVLMVESEVKELDEETMLGAIEFGHKAIQPVIDMINDFAAQSSVEKLPITVEDNSELERSIKEFINTDVENAFKITVKQEREKALTLVREKLSEKFITDDADDSFKNKVDFIFKDLEKAVVRNALLTEGKRIDGRTKDQVRPINVEVDILPMSHGSALFTRGETQSLGVLTLGTSYDEQTIDGVTNDPDSKEHFMMHYNFPPYAVGECGKLTSPGRREIGHGRLAWRALHNVIPNREIFPYTIRLVSEITESNGSSSMATVCSGCLAMMAGGVPIKKTVAGIAMGLVKEKDSFIVLTDIMGDEDHLGDMDFKVAGTKDSITALQMDIKCNGVTLDIMRTALTQAREGRLHILNEMEKIISSPRSEVSKYAPKIVTIKIASDKIKDVIGSQGKVIKSITEETDTNIDIEDNGLIKIFGMSLDNINRAVEIIKGITFEPKINDIYDGKVVKIINSGAFVSLSNTLDGFVHISELADYRIDFVDDVLTEGKMIKVKVIGFDKKGKPKLSYKDVNQKTGEDLSKKNF